LARLAIAGPTRMNFFVRLSRVTITSLLRPARIRP
jgi:hypothetical protein